MADSGACFEGHLMLEPLEACCPFAASSTSELVALDTAGLAHEIFSCLSEARSWRGRRPGRAERQVRAAATARRRSSLAGEPQACAALHNRDALYVGVDVVRCRRNRLAAMLNLGVCRGDRIVLDISARSHVDAATLRRALEHIDAAWSEGKKHMAKLSVNAMIGLWTRAAGWTARARTSQACATSTAAHPDRRRATCAGKDKHYDGQLTGLPAPKDAPHSPTGGRSACLAL